MTDKEKALRDIENLRKILYLQHKENTTRKVEVGELWVIVALL